MNFDAFKSTGIVCLLGLIALSVMSGCETRVVSQSRAPWAFAEERNAEMERRQQYQANRDQDEMTSEGPENQVWAIAVDAFEGPDQQERAEAAVKQFTKETLIKDFWIDTDDGKTIIYLGKFRSPRVKQAQDDLKLLKDLAAAGRLSVERTLLILTPVTGQTTIANEADLRSMAGLGSYTLQVGFYEGEGREDAAEAAVRTLREENFDAFYYHGPNYSQITVGIFDESEVALMPVDPGNRENTALEMYYSPRIKQLRERFPHNLANGRELVETHAGHRRVQPSFIVKIPGS